MGLELNALFIRTENVTVFKPLIHWPIA